MGRRCPYYGSEPSCNSTFVLCTSGYRTCSVYRRKSRRMGGSNKPIQNIPSDTIFAFRLMKCPYCYEVFGITEKQFNSNGKFRCPICGKYNSGSMSADENGILLGVKTEESWNYE